MIHKFSSEILFVNIIMNISEFLLIKNINKSNTYVFKHIHVIVLICIEVS